AGYPFEAMALPPETSQSSWMGTLFAMWTLEHWGMITKTSQPYYPSMMDIQHPTPAPAYPVLEVPDNGTLADYMSAQAMIDVLHMNWPDGKSLAAPTVFQVGFHPPSFNQSYYPRLDAALHEVAN